MRGIATRFSYGCMISRSLLVQGPLLDWHREVLDDNARNRKCQAVRDASLSQVFNSTCNSQWCYFFLHFTGCETEWEVKDLKQITKRVSVYQKWALFSIVQVFPFVSLTGFQIYFSPILPQLTNFHSEPLSTSDISCLMKVSTFKSVSLVAGVSLLPNLLF